MKVFGFIAAVLLVSSAHATQPITGPYIYKTLGKPGTDAKWASCLVLPGQVIRENGAGDREVVSVKLDAQEMETAIRVAVKSSLETGGIHIMATNPAVRVSVGVFPKIGETLLFEDASRIMVRKGTDARDLIMTAKNLCGKMVAK